MPPIGAVIAGAAAALGTLIAAEVITTAILWQAAALFVGTVVLGTIAARLTPQPDLDGFGALGGGFVAEARGRTIMVRQPIAGRRMVIGEVTRLSGTLAFIEATGDNQFLHLVITLCDGPIQAINTVYIDGVPIDPADIDGSDNVINTRYEDKVRIKKHLGAADQAADSDLVAEVAQWTTSHRARNVAYLYVRLEFDSDVFPGGIPNINADVKGALLFDTRDSQTRWSTNAALGLRHWLTDARLGLGFTAAEIDDANWDAEADACDEFVAAGNYMASMNLVVPGTDIIRLGTVMPFQTGDRVTASVTGGSLPGGLAPATNYYVIVVARLGRREDAISGSQLKLSTTYAGALAETGVVNITSEGSGARELTRAAEPRYTTNGVIASSRRPGAAISDLLTACGGRAVYIGGKWRLHVARWVAPTITLDEGDLRGSMRIETRLSSRDRFNAVHGVYVSPLNFGQPSDYPAVTNATYQTADGGTRKFAGLDLPFTSRGGAAQRLAKIELERARQEITVQAPYKLDALQLQAGDRVMIDSVRMGWTAKTFEVTNSALAGEAGTDGAPVMGVDLVLRETASENFDWNAGEETVVDPSPNTNLPDAFTVRPPGAPVVTEVLYTTRAGGGVKAKATLAWAASVDSFVTSYQVEYKETAVSDWIVVPRTPDRTVEILDIAAGVYDFRVRAFNHFGVASTYSAINTSELFGLAVPPADITGLTVAGLGGMALLRWDRHPDLDVLQGGKILIRHSAALTGAVWSSSVSMTTPLDGSAIEAILPLKSGSYLLKAQDSSNIRSVNAVAVATDQATVLAYSGLTTVTEEPGFDGTHSGTAGGSGVLQLDGVDNIDDWGTVDSINNWDSEGGVVLAGTYLFAVGIDLGSVKRARLTTTIVAVISNLLDLIDDRTADIDDWEDFDGTGTAAADAVVQVRHTPDDPGGAPTWSAWQRLEAAEYFKRGFEFRVQLTTEDPAFNIAVSQLSVIAEELT